MKTGNELVEQVDAKGDIFFEEDQSYSRKELREILSGVFNVSDTENGAAIAKYKGEIFAIYAKNVTHLGIPHPAYKKRIQIGNNFKRQLAYFDDRGIKTILLGVYKHDDVLIFVDFDISTYRTKAANNSSAHVYSYDLQQAFYDGITTKVDRGGNRLTLFASDRVGVFLDSKFDLQGQGATDSVFEKKRRLFRFLDAFFDSVPQKWNGIDCYKEMIEADFHRKFQPEWPGAYLEYLFENYLTKFPNGPIQKHSGHSQSALDFDLYLPELETYGDLKCHTIGVGAIPGNDYESVMAVLQDGALYYVVLEHDTIKDSEMDYVTTKFWNTAQEKKNLMSYYKRMKGAVILKDYRILEINSLNAKYLGSFQKGFVNSDGKPRKEKIQIGKSDVDNFSEYVYEFARF